MSKRVWLLLILIVILSSILRLYKLGQVPPGIYWDEASIGYNAYSILKTGRDEHNVFFPLWFKAYGEYKLPVYIYLTSISEYFFGKNEFSVRLPSAFSGILSTIIIFLLVRHFSPRRNKLSLLSSFFLTIVPWSIHFSRGGFEANVMLFFILLGIYLFSKGKVISSFFFLVLTFYTYNSARIITPLLILSLLLLYRRQLNSINSRKYILAIISLIIFSIPFIKFSLSQEGLARPLSVSFLKENVEIASSPVPKIIDYLNLILRNYIRHFSLDFLFMSGDQHGRHGVRELGLLYIWQIPLILIGLAILKKEKYLGKILILLLLISPVAAAISIPTPHALRSLTLVIPLSIISAFGLLKIRPFVLKALSIFLLFYFLTSYLHIYYIHYPKNTYLDWQDGYKQLYKSIQKYEKSYEKVVITKEYEQPYIYLLFYNYEPSKYNTEPKKDGNFGKFIFIKGQYNSDINEKTLYVSGPNDKINAKRLEDIYFINRDVAFSLWEL